MKQSIVKGSLKLAVAYLTVVETILGGTKALLQNPKLVTAATLIDESFNETIDAHQDKIIKAMSDLDQAAQEMQPQPNPGDVQ